MKRSTDKHRGKIEPPWWLVR